MDSAGAFRPIPTTPVCRLARPDDSEIFAEQKSRQTTPRHPGRRQYLGIEPSSKSATRASAPLVGKVAGFLLDRARPQIAPELDVRCHTETFAHPENLLLAREFPQALRGDDLGSPGFTRARSSLRRWRPPGRDHPRRSDSCRPARAPGPLMPGAGAGSRHWRGRPASSLALRRPVRRA